MSKRIVEEASRGWARIEGLYTALLLCQSATAVLEAWCAQALPADRASAISVRRIATSERPATSEQRQRLDVPPDEAIIYRRVELLFEGHVLSEASNWYVPRRLTAAMNGLLEASTIPFGHVVTALAPSRRTIRSQRFFDPASDRTGAVSIPPILFEHRAVLTAQDGAPLAEVEEHYTSALIAFAGEAGFLPPPRRDGADEGSEACLDIR